MKLHPLVQRLTEVERKARSLPWHRERAWRTVSHLGWDGGLPRVDLHDLSVRLALEVVEALVATPVEQGGVVLITGRGKHTGGRSKLRDAVEDALAEHQARGRLRFHPRGPGRFEVVFDEDAARAARPGMGLLFWLFVALLLAGIGATLWNALNP